jgi:hypothetical protein
MRIGLAISTGSAIALLVLGAQAASATRTVGESCAGDVGRPGTTLMPFNTTETYTLPYHEGGIVTGWNVVAGPGVGPLAQRLVVLRGSGEEVVKVGESALETVREGVNEFATRIPTEGALVALHGPVETLFCSERLGGAAGVIAGEAPFGEARPFEIESDVGVPLTVTIERDEDGDGYGDESQDRCTDNPAFHESCPFVVFLPAKHGVTRGAVLVRATINATSQVSVFGHVGWTVRTKAAGPGRPGPQRRVTVALDGGTKEIAAGTTAVFSVRMPRAVRRRLARMRPRERLWARVTAVASGARELEGRTMQKTLNFGLQGRGKSAERR